MALPGASARVAVVIPCFNDGATLVETLRSLEREEPHQAVVVDDGSTDPATLALLAELEREGVRVLHQENAGSAAARMRGVLATDARYVLALDSDDLLVAGWLARLADVLDADPSVSVVWGDTEVFGDFERVDREADVLDGWLLSYECRVPTASLVRRSALLEAGGWRASLRSWEDWDLWQTLAEQGYRGRRVEGVFMRYRRHGVRKGMRAADAAEARLALLRSLHPTLFSHRRELRKASPLPWQVKLFFPLVEACPGLSWRTRAAIYHQTLDAALSGSYWAFLRGVYAASRKLLRAAATAVLHLH
jgi:glycosyltransferase involved in cell wall biosynthesis